MSALSSGGRHKKIVSVIVAGVMGGLHLCAQAEQLKVTLELEKLSITSGEVLPVTVTLQNVGTNDMQSAYFQPQQFRDNALVTFEVRQGEQLMGRFGSDVNSGGIKVAFINFEAIGVSMPDSYRLGPFGRTVQASRRVLLMIRGQTGTFQFIQPGGYLIRAIVSLELKKSGGLEWETFESADTQFNVMPLAESDQPAAALIASVPHLDALLQRRLGEPPSETLAKLDELTQRFPQLPHLPFLHYRVLQQQMDSIIEGSSEESRAEAFAQCHGLVSGYLQRYSDSAYADDLMFTLASDEASFAETPEELTGAIHTFESILTAFPNSPLREDIQNKLAVLREKLAAATAPPSITLLGDNPVTVECRGIYADAGVTANDEEDGDVSSSITVSNAVESASVGTYSVTYTVIDSAGNKATATRTVNVVDSLPSQISCPLPISVACDVALTVHVNFTVSATDSCDTNVTLTCSPSSDSGFKIGTTNVVCNAWDASGNTNTCTFTVTRAALGFAGFLAPIGGADGTGGTYTQPVRTFKLGSKVPVKFTASCSGSAVTNGVHTLQVIKWSNETTAEEPIDASPADAATTGNQFHLTGDDWHYNLDTAATAMSVGTWELRATLSDGSAHSAFVALK